MIEPLRIRFENNDGCEVVERSDVLDVADKLNELIASYNSHFHDVNLDQLGVGETSLPSELEEK